MTKTTPVVIHLNEAEKADLERQAIAEGCSLSKLIRDRALTTDEDVLAVLLSWLKDSTSRANEALDRSLAHSARLDAEAPAREAAIIAAARAELAGVDLEALAALLFPDPRGVSK